MLLVVMTPIYTNISKYQPLLIVWKRKRWVHLKPNISTLLFPANWLWPFRHHVLLQTSDVCLHNGFHPNVVAVQSSQLVLAFEALFKTLCIPLSTLFFFFFGVKTLHASHGQCLEVLKLYFDTKAWQRVVESALIQIKEEVSATSPLAVLLDCLCRFEPWITALFVLQLHPPVLNL